MLVEDVRVTDPGAVAQVRHAVGQALVAQRERYRLAGTPLEPEDERQLAQQLIDEAVRDFAATALANESRVVPPGQQEDLARAVWAAMYQSDRLQTLLDMPGVENVNCIGHDKVFIKYADGRKERWPGVVAESDEGLVQLVRRMAGWVGLSSRPWDITNPTLRLRLPKGERLTAINWVCERPSVSIRRSLHPQMGLEKLVEEFGTCSVLAADFLKHAVLARRTIIVTGDQGAGKTAMVRALIREIPSRERIFSAEESLELDIAGIGIHDDVVELEARQAYGEQTGRVTLTDLVRAMLTQDVDRQIIGECTGPEVIALLNATLGGSGGSLTTLHTKGPRGAPNRIATFAAQAEERLSREAALMLVAEAVDLVVHMRVIRDETGAKRRVVSDIVEINEFNGSDVAQSDLFVWNPETGQAEPRTKTLMSAYCMDRLIEAGFDPWSHGLAATGSWGAS